MRTKSIFLARGKPSEKYPQFEKRINDWIDRELNALPKVKLTITREPPPRWGVIPYKADLVALISVESDRDSDFMKTVPEGFAGVYSVTEALPVSYQKKWPDRQPTPGVCLLTLFRQKPGLDRSIFLQRWHQGHTPLSLLIHPLWNYNRNVVESPALGSEPFDGIVEEQFRSAHELTNAIRFFGGNFLLVPWRMLQVYFDVRSFIDYPSIETYWAHEIHVRS